MYDQGYITKEEYEKAKAEEVKIVASKDALKETDNNSYFVDALIDQVVRALMDKFGYEKTHANQIFYSSGYKIYATVDANIQKTMETVFPTRKPMA